MTDLDLFVSGLKFQYGGFAAGAWAAPFFALILLALVLFPAWTILRRMGLSTARSLVYLILAAIPFAQLWVLWDLSGRPWPGQPEGIGFTPEKQRRRVETDDRDD